MTLLGLVALLGAGPAHAADRCHPAGSRTIARSAQLRVYREHGHLLACRRDDGRPQAVTSRTDWGPIAVYRNDVAVALSGCDERGCATQLRAVRVRRGSATPLETVFTTAAAANVSKVAIGRHGTLAWTECEPDAFRDYLCGPGGDSVISIWISSSGTPVPARLDRARGVRALSVRLARGRVHWRNRGPRSAPIPR